MVHALTLESASLSSNVASFVQDLFRNQSKRNSQRNFQLRQFQLNPADGRRPAAPIKQRKSRLGRSIMRTIAGRGGKGPLDRRIDYEQEAENEVDQRTAFDVDAILTVDLSSIPAVKAPPIDDDVSSYTVGVGYSIKNSEQTEKIVRTSKVEKKMKDVLSALDSMAEQEQKKGEKESLPLTSGIDSREGESRSGNTGRPGMKFSMLNMGTSLEDDELEELLDYNNPNVSPAGTLQTNEGEILFETVEADIIPLESDMTGSIDELQTKTIAEDKLDRSSYTSDLVLRTVREGDMLSPSMGISSDIEKVIDKLTVVMAEAFQLRSVMSDLDEAQAVSMRQV